MFFLISNFGMQSRLEMWAGLRTLLFRFVGGGNSKYAIEILELLQGLRQEWPEDIKKHIKTWCWLMNRTGKPGSFLPFDLGQEENIADIKVNYRSMGPGATIWNTAQSIPRHSNSTKGSASHGSRIQDQSSWGISWRAR